MRCCGGAFRRDMWEQAARRHWGRSAVPNLQPEKPLMPPFSSPLPSFPKQLQVAQARTAYLEQAMVERSIVSRQEALICDLENKLQFQNVQIKRFEVPHVFF